MKRENSILGVKSWVPFVFIAVGATFLPRLAAGGLAHRWSFNDGTANDSAGTAHGALYGGEQDHTVSRWHFVCPA